MANADRIIDLLHEAKTRPAGAERERFLAEACRDDAALKEQIVSLLEADAAEGVSDFLKVTRIIGPRILPNEKAGDRIGRYMLLEQIGEGGCGVVYVAEQKEPVRRRVALKVIKLGMDTKQVIARFEAERQALAMMDHPNIAKVLDAGATDTGRPYFVMELVRGIKITDFCDQHQLSPRERLELFIQVCRAIQHAHQKGVMHRDIKPSNILVTSDDGLPVPKVIDFGIAKATQGRLTDQTVYTAFEQFIGTPAYMSPEQAEMSLHDIDTRTDIYSLGVLLYEVLTGKTPFDATELVASGLEAMRRTIREKQPARPSTRLSTMMAGELTATARQRHTEAPRLIYLLRGDLDWIVMKCLEKERSRRYETANGLATDIQRHLRNEPVAARPPSRFYEFQKTIRRHKFGFAAAAILVLVLALGTLVSTWQAVRASRAEHAQIRLRLQEEAARARAETSERAARNQLYTALLEQASATVRSGEMGQRVRALEAVRRAAAISNSAELRGAALAALALPDLRFEREIATPSKFADLDPGFERLAIPRGLGATEIRTLSDGRLLASLAPGAKASAHATWWSPDGAFLAVKRDRDAVGYNAYLEVWAAADARRVLLLEDLSGDGVGFHPSLPQIVTGRQGGTASVFDLNSGKEVARFKLPANAWRLQLAPDGKRLAFAGQTSNGWLVSIHNAADGSLLASNRWGDQPMDLSWSPAGDCLAVPDLKGEVHLMDARSGEARVLGQHKAQAAKTAFSPDGLYLFTGGWERELICWDVRVRRRLFSVNLDSYILQFNKNGRECAVRTTSGAFKFYAFDRPTHREFAEDLGGRVRHASFSPDGKWLAASGFKSLGLWSLRGNAPGALLEAGAESRTYFTPDGRELFTSRDEDCGRWKIREGTNADSTPELICFPLRKPAGFSSICLASNLLVITATNHSSIVPLDHLEDEFANWTSTESGNNAVSPDGRWLGINRSFSSSLYIYSVPGLERVAKITGNNNIGAFEFSRSGDELAVTAKGMVTFWSTANWQAVRVMTNTMEFLYSPDPGTCWLADDYRSAGLRDTRTLEMLLPLPVGTHPLALSADGRHLAVSVDLRRVQVWDLAEVRAQLRELGLDWPER